MEVFIKDFSTDELLSFASYLWIYKYMIGVFQPQFTSGKLGFKFRYPPFYKDGVIKACNEIKFSMACDGIIDRVDLTKK